MMIEEICDDRCGGLLARKRVRQGFDGVRSSCVSESVMATVNR